MNYTTDFKSIRAEVSAEEWQARVDLAACYRLVDKYGMTDLIYNHITARIPGSKDRLLINLYGMLYKEITASTLVKINVEGAIIWKPDTDYGINKSGYVIHGAIHKARPDVACVLHTHTRACATTGSSPAERPSSRPSIRCTSSKCPAARRSMPWPRAPTSSCPAKTCSRIPRTFISPARAARMACWNGRQCCACSMPRSAIRAIRLIGSKASLFVLGIFGFSCVIACESGRSSNHIPHRDYWMPCFRGA